MRRRILLVEDDASTRTVMRALLELEGFEVDACQDGRQAVTRLRECTYDELVTDLLMPSLSGLELIEVARRLQPKLGCIVVTGACVAQELAPPVRAWLRKPIDFDRLLRVLQG